MTTATTYDERMALIKQIAERKKNMTRIKAKSKTVMRKMPKPARTFMDVPGEDTAKNPMYWTDAPKYAEQYYGETYRATTQYDNDWGDY